MTISAEDPARIGDACPPGVTVLRDMLAVQERPRVIEVGTRRSDPEFPTHHTAWAPHGEWTKVDAEDGQDVDVVDDAHTLATFWEVAVHAISQLPHRVRCQFDAYVACSVFEHLRRPWVAMKEAATVVRPGGLVYVQTHQTFPLHGYPSDYFRFSKEALAGLMEDAGLVVLEAGYMYPCRIQPPPEVTRWNTAPDVEAWLNVEALGQVPASS